MAKEQAVTKLRDEIDQNKSNSYVQVVGEFLLQHLEQQPADAVKILSTDKTISKSLDAMRNEASKKKTGNYAMFTPQEGFEIVLKYFGIKENTAVPVIASAPAPVQEAPKAPASTNFDVRLEDLL